MDLRSRNQNDHILPLFLAQVHFPLRAINLDLYIRHLIPLLDRRGGSEVGKGRVRCFGCVLEDGCWSTSKHPSVSQLYSLPIPQYVINTHTACSLWERPVGW